MNKSQLIDAVKQKTDLTKKDVELVVSTVFESMEEALITGDKVAIAGFGTFAVRERAERRGRNPKTQEEIVVPRAKVPVFRPFKTLKEAIDK
ncbi:MAG: DNA-binding protein HU [Firmicutes bacterium]|nr:DNA-binding protein HU [Bacillota bacterium]MBT9157695.1 DNA-binding protein HU [Bacillota bacterium]